MAKKKPLRENRDGLQLDAHVLTGDCLDRRDRTFDAISNSKKTVTGRLWGLLVTILVLLLGSIGTLCAFAWANGARDTCISTNVRDIGALRVSQHKTEAGLADTREKIFTEISDVHDEMADGREKRMKELSDLQKQMTEDKGELLDAIRAR